MSETGPQEEERVGGRVDCNGEGIVRTKEPKRKRRARPNSRGRTVKAKTVRSMGSRGSGKEGTRNEHWNVTTVSNRKILCNDVRKGEGFFEEY